MLGMSEIWFLWFHQSVKVKSGNGLSDSLETWYSERWCIIEPQTFVKEIEIKTIKIQRKKQQCAIITRSRIILIKCHSSQTNRSAKSTENWCVTTSAKPTTYFAFNYSIGYQGLHDFPTLHHTMPVMTSSIYGKSDNCRHGATVHFCK